MQDIASNLKNKKAISEFEFVALMAFLMSNVALSIDTILPALPNLGEALQVANENQLQQVIFMLFLGLGVGELFFGTLSDSLGRKPIVYTGVVIFILASILIVFSPDLKTLLFGRVVQGIGLSAARSVCIAIIRDTYKGDRMARIMSFITTIFILVPMIAPLIGQIILKAFNWQAIFYFQIVFIAITITWFSFRQNETLSESNKVKISRHLFKNGVKEYFKFKEPILFTIISGFLNGAFITYLGSSQQIFQGQYQMDEAFPYIFGGLAFSFGVAALTNASLVIKYGMMKLVQTSLYFYLGIAFIYLLLFSNASQSLFGISYAGNPPIAILIAFLALQFLSLGFISGNLSALAMQPIGHIAGIGAAIFSFTSMTLGVIFAYLIGTFIIYTALPLFIGFLLSGIIAIVIIKYVRSYRLKYA